MISNTMFNVTKKVLLRSSTSRFILPTASTSLYSFSSETKPSLTALVKQLRLKTGAPMVECKKALEASEHDIPKATEWLRSNSLSKVSSKLENRISEEGLVGLSIKDGNAVLVKVSSETDFASRSSTFSKLVQDVASTALNLKPGGDNKSLPDLLLNMKVEENENQTVQNYLEEATLSIREKLELKEVEVLHKAGDKSVVMGYVHGKVPDYSNVGTSAALVELVSTKDGANVDEMKEIGKKLAMHVVAAKPKYLNPESVPEEVLAKEKEILKIQISKLPGSDKKPPEILEKIVIGKLGKFYQDVCLSKQGHMLEEKNPMIEKYLSGHGLKVTSYKYISI